MSREIETTVTVYVDDVLDDISTEDLIAELSARKKQGQHNDADDLEDIRHALMGGRMQEALVLLERIMFPRGNPAGALTLAKTARDPATGRPVIQ